MQSRPVFHKQEIPYSCAPAYLRMILSGFGIEKSEAELHELCDCGIFGTDALKVVDAARQLGFSNTKKCTLSIQELENLLVSNSYPIVYVNLLPIDGYKCAHAIVVTGVEETVVSVYDPLQGERKLSRSNFESAWSMMLNLSILVQA
ncbi:MAG: cysteine peptidase family C39 domain-containing protein [Calothrix sp. MO_167.B42]|nr:cysteine peptidase family C39 domain-containing protein [Calothrix sp. MO_167.B42]